MLYYYAFDTIIIDIQKYLMKKHEIMFGLIKKMFNQIINWPS